MARNTGWIPNQHGAWAMLAVPFVVGTVRGARDHGFAWASIPLFGLWIVGYLAFFAVSLWLKSRRRPRYVRPAVTYAVAAGACGIAVLLLDPGIAVWALGFAPFLAVGLAAAAARTDRSVLAGVAMVVAASLMTVVAYDVGGPGTHAPGTDTAPIWLLAGLVLAYFLGTVLYVKSAIRQRGVRVYLLVSVVYHAAVTVALVVVASFHDPGWWWAVALGAALTVRAALVPSRPVSAKAIGIGEAVASVAVLVLGTTLG